MGDEYCRPDGAAKQAFAGGFSHAWKSPGCIAEPSAPGFDLRYCGWATIIRQGPEWQVRRPRPLGRRDWHDDPPRVITYCIVR